jgi:hypothetical protein
MVRASTVRSTHRSRPALGALLGVAALLVMPAGMAGADVTPRPMSVVSSYGAGAPPAPAPDETVPGETVPDGSAPVEIVQSWTLAPASGDQGASRPELSYQASPGTTIEDRVVLYNFGNVPMNFRVYATDAFNNDDGQFDLLGGDEIPTGVGSWVRLDVEQITLEPGMQATIPMRITVPLDAAPGDHAGAVVAASVTSGDSDAGPTIDVERRTGTRLYVQVAGPLTPVLAVTDVQGEYPRSINPWSAPLELRFTVENRGNVRLGGVPKVTVAGPLGLGRRTVELPALVELLPGESTEVVGVVGAPGLVLLTATVEIEPVGSAALGKVASTSASDRVFAPPLLVLLVALMALFGLLAVRAFGRHAVASPEVPVDDAVGDEVSV